MATVNFIRYKYQSASVLKRVGDYVVQDHKTAGRELVSGLNCSPQFAVREFIATRNSHRKSGPVWFYHYTQSFHPDEPITGEQAHAIAKEFAARAWPDSEVLITTHIDAEHIHSHFIINAVCHETGMMLRQGPDTLFHLRPISDELCMKYGFSVLKKAPRRSNGMSSREYRAAKKGLSWKLRLSNTIDECMRFSASKDEFIALMRSEGYEVKWMDSRKNITYILQDGKKCNDDKLHDSRYLKEVMEHEFRIREEIISGRIEAAQYGSDDSSNTGSAGHDTAGSSSDTDAAPAQHTHGAGVAGDDVLPAGAVSDRADADRPVGSAVEETERLCHEGTDGRTDPSDAGTAESGGTGWETEREAFFAGKTQTAQSGTAPNGRSRPVPAAVGAGNPASALARLGRAVEDDTDDTDDPDEQRRRIEAKIEAENFGYLAGVAIGIGVAIAEHLTEQQQTPEQPEQPKVPEQDESQGIRWEQSM